MAVQIEQRARGQNCTMFSTRCVRFRPDPSVIRSVCLLAGRVAPVLVKQGEELVFLVNTHFASNPCTSKICSVEMYPQRVDQACPSNTVEVSRLPTDSIQQRDVDRVIEELKRLNVDAVPSRWQGRTFSLLYHLRFLDLHGSGIGRIVGNSTF